MTPKKTLFLPALINKLVIVERHLHDKTFLMGDQLTLADSYLFVILVWLAKLKFNMTDLPNLSRYFVEMKQRKSVLQALEEEDLVNLSLY